METLARKRHSSISLEMISPSLCYTSYIDRSRGHKQPQHSPVSIFTSLVLFNISEVAQYHKALQSYERQEKRKALSLAHATRQSLVIEEQLANQRVKEAEIMMDLLYSNVKRAHVQVAEVDMHIGALRAMLDAEGISEISLSDDEESPFDIIPATSSCESSEGLSNESDSDSGKYSIFYLRLSIIMPI